MSKVSKSEANKISSKDKRKTEQNLFYRGRQVDKRKTEQNLFYRGRQVSKIVQLLENGGLKAL